MLLSVMTINHSSYVGSRWRDKTHRLMTQSGIFCLCPASVLVSPSDNSRHHQAQHISTVFSHLCRSHCCCHSSLIVSENMVQADPKNAVIRRQVQSVQFGYARFSFHFISSLPVHHTCTMQMSLT